MMIIISWNNFIRVFNRKSANHKIIHTIKLNEPNELQMVDNEKQQNQFKMNDSIVDINFKIYNVKFTLKFEVSNLTHSDFK